MNRQDEAKELKEKLDKLITKFPMEISDDECEKLNNLMGHSRQAIKDWTRERDMIIRFQGGIGKFENSCNCKYCNELKDINKALAILIARKY